MTVKELSKLLDIKDAAISRLIKRGSLIKSGPKRGGVIDPADPINKQWLMGKMSKNVVKKREAAIELLEGDSDDKTSKAYLEKEKLKEDIEGKRLKNERERKEVIPVKLLEKLFIQMSTIDHQEILIIAHSFPEQALAQVGIDDPKVIHQMRVDLNKILYDAIGHRNRILEEFLMDPFSEEDNFGGKEDI